MGTGPRLTSKNLANPDGERPLGRGAGGYVELGGLVVGHAVLQPGWRWSEDIKPNVGTASCELHHLQLVLSGRFAVRMDGGEEREYGPNELIDVPPGHDTWVVGDEPLVLLEMSGNAPEMGLPASRARTVLTMLMTDIVGSTQTAAQIGDAAWRRRLGDHNRVVRRQLVRFGGREIDTTGDGFLAAFTSAESALRAAVAICSAVADADVEIRAGVHTGEVDVIDDGDLRGIAVHETARIMAAAPAGTVYTSGITRLLAGASGLVFVSAGGHALKGFEAPVDLFEVQPGA